MKEPTTNLSSDQPELYPDNDVLGYAPFAKYLAKSIIEMTPRTGIVIGLYGPWGAGKTTLINFVEYFLKQESKDVRPLVVPFNPWWFSGQDDLARIFFSELLKALGKQDKFKDLRGKLAGYADALGVIPVYGAAAKEAAKLVKPTEKTIIALKADLSKILTDLNCKILIVIDDIDRLTAEETRQLFRVVKAVADFPNVIYILAFDRAVAAKALESVHVGDGNAFLEKIVQVPFELPMPDKSLLENMLFKQLNEILGLDESDASSDTFDLSYWINVYREGISPLIKTPRDVVRLTNTLTVTYPSVRGEVNVVDFVAVEILRVFLPEVYAIIRSNADMFVHSTPVQSYEKKKFTEFHANWIGQVQQKYQECVISLMLRLFPATEIAWDRRWTEADDKSTWRRRCRIAQPEVFPVYFRLSPPQDDLPTKRMREIISNISDVAGLITVINDLQSKTRPDGSTLARRFLERFEDYTEDFSIEGIPIVVRALFGAGDGLIQREPERKQTYLDIGINIQIARITHRLLRRLDAMDRFTLLKQAISETDCYYVSSEEVATIGQAHGKYGGSKSERGMTVTLDHLQELEQIVLSKIRTNINLPDFGGSMHLRRLLHVWENLGSADEVGKWLYAAIANDAGLLQALVQFLSHVDSHTAGDPIMRRNYRLDPKWFQPYVDPAALRMRVEQLASNSELSTEQRIAVLEFLQEYEDRESGLNPDNMAYMPRRTVFERYGNLDLNRNNNDED